MSLCFPTRAFLPPSDPLGRLPGEFRIWDELTLEIPKLLAAGIARNTLQSIPHLDPLELRSQSERERALGILSVFAHVAVNESWRTSTAGTVPKSIAVPWVILARNMRRFPVLTYSSHGLNNWRRLDPDGPIGLGNIVALRNFFGGLDEEWFIMLHVDIEARAIPILYAVKSLYEADSNQLDPQWVSGELAKIATSIEGMISTLLRVQENCNPDIFFNRVQPFMHGMKGVIYEGVVELKENPQNYPGGSGAQSALLPLLDAVLGVRHAPDALISYLHELRRYMPVEHQEFLSAIESSGFIREFVLSTSTPELTTQYNRCLEELARFRDEHLKITIEYIQRPALRQASDRGERGTGGSPFVGYLKKHRKETLSNIIK